MVHHVKPSLFPHAITSAVPRSRGRARTQQQPGRHHPFFRFAPAISRNRPRALVIEKLERRRRTTRYAKETSRGSPPRANWDCGIETDRNRSAVVSKPLNNPTEQTNPTQPTT